VHRTLAFAALAFNLSVPAMADDTNAKLMKRYLDPEFSPWWSKVGRIVAIDPWHIYLGYSTGDSIQITKILVPDFMLVGGVLTNTSGGDSYRFSDLRIGDDVNIRMDCFEKQEYGVAFIINRRDFGGIPEPPRPYRDPDKIPYHIKANAMNDALAGKYVPEDVLRLYKLYDVANMIYGKRGTKAKPLVPEK